MPPSERLARVVRLPSGRVRRSGAGGALSVLGLTGCESTPAVMSSGPSKAAKAAPRVVVIGGGVVGVSTLYQQHSDTEGC